MTAVPRRTCPACTRRYAGLIASDCPVCKGLGTLALGAAILHHYDPAPAARAIELYLEATAQRVRLELPLGQHRDALEAAVDDLRHAGVLASTADAAGHPARTRTTNIDDTATTVSELDAYRATRTLGATATTDTITALTATPIPLTNARPRDGRPPQASATGHPSALATITDPIDPLGPDAAELDLNLYRQDHTANVIATAVPTASHRRRHRP